jgi:hypothetical protein
MSVSIKGVDQSAFRNLKAEAVRCGVNVGDAATEAFRMWVASKRQNSMRDQDKMLRAAKEMDALRTRHKSAWSGVEEIRKWRDQRS